MSGHRYARAMRSLAGWHYTNNNFLKSMECYQKALAINALFENSWFALGCAAMQVKDWEEGQRAFTRCVMLEAANGEAWNNLAAIYINTDRKYVLLGCRMWSSHP